MGGRGRSELSGMWRTGEEAGLSGWRRPAGQQRACGQTCWLVALRDSGMWGTGKRWEQRGAMSCWLTGKFPGCSGSRSWTAGALSGKAGRVRWFRQGGLRLWPGPRLETPWEGPGTPQPHPGGFSHSLQPCSSLQPSLLLL